MFRHTFPRSRWRACRSLLVVVLLLTLLMRGDGHRHAPLREPPPYGSGMTRTICLALETSPRLRLGVVWTTPIFSYIPSLMLAPMKACVELPYDPASGTTPWLPRELLLIP
jgi:hypothetical protein